MNQTHLQALDQNGVGQLVKMAVEKGHKTRPELKCGICGETWRRSIKY